MAESAVTLVLKPVAGSFAICRLPTGTALPHWFHPGGFASVSWSDEALSIVCDESMVPEDVQCERAWSCLVLQGPFPFHMTGVLARVLQPLALACLVMNDTRSSSGYNIQDQTKLLTEVEKLGAGDPQALPGGGTRRPRGGHAERSGRRLRLWRCAW